MCGIIGCITGRSGKAMPEGERANTQNRAVADGLRRLHHRGPDAHATMSIEHDGVQASFGHARLAILDLSEAAAQPMQRREGRYTLVFNGEVYNFRALRGELEGLGVRFVSDGDTEVVLEALIHWGEAALTRFVGMFALALWDRDQATLLLARDRVGIKPLYWQERNDSMVFASEARALVGAGLCGAPTTDVREAGLGAWFGLAGCEDPWTLVPGLENLLPGHLLVWSPGGAAQIRRFWEPRPLSTPPSDPRRALAETLDVAVRDRLVSDVPLGVFLSGGVDSAAIAAVAARHVPESLETFTLSFSEGAFDERDRAARVARHLGVRHHVATITPDEALAAVEPAFAAQDFPSHDGVNTWLVARAARQAGLVVCLSGTGGDELFSGYNHFHRIESMLLPGRVARHLPERLQQHILGSWSQRFPTRIRKAIALIGTAGDVGALVRLVREVFSETQTRALLGTSVQFHASSATDAPNLSSLDNAGRMSVAELAGYLRNTQMRDIDVMSMAHGLEVRVPLLDHRLIALCLSLPAALKAPHGGLNKPLLVEAANLPPDLMRAPKMGFTLPWEVWLRGPLRAFAEDALFGPSPAPLQGRVVRMMWQDFIAQHPRINAVRILALISLRLWYRRMASITP